MEHVLEGGVGGRPSDTAGDSGYWPEPADGLNNGLVSSRTSARPASLLPPNVPRYSTLPNQPFAYLAVAAHRLNTLPMTAAPISAKSFPPSLSQRNLSEQLVAPSTGSVTAHLLERIRGYKPLSSFEYMRNRSDTAFSVQSMISGQSDGLSRDSRSEGPRLSIDSEGFGSDASTRLPSKPRYKSGIRLPTKHPGRHLNRKKGKDSRGSSPITDIVPVITPPRSVSSRNSNSSRLHGLARLTAGFSIPTLVALLLPLVLSSLSLASLAALPLLFFLPVVVLLLWYPIFSVLANPEASQRSLESYVSHWVAEDSHPLLSQCATLLTAASSCFTLKWEPCMRIVRDKVLPDTRTDLGRITGWAFYIAFSALLLLLSILALVPITVFLMPLYTILVSSFNFFFLPTWLLLGVPTVAFFNCLLGALVMCVDQPTGYRTSEWMLGSVARAYEYVVGTVLPVYGTFVRPSRVSSTRRRWHEFMGSRHQSVDKGQRDFVKPLGTRLRRKSADDVVKTWTLTPKTNPTGGRDNTTLKGRRASSRFLSPKPSQIN